MEIPVDGILVKLVKPVLDGVPALSFELMWAWG
jgi:hypothetical protein